MSKVLHQSLASLQGSEWDSSDDEEAEHQQPTNTSSSKSNNGKHNNQQSSTEKSGKKKHGSTKHTKDDDDDDDDVDEKDLVMYIGHLPKEMQERDLRAFLMQFGNVQNCRVARKISSGQPKGYAFVRFEDVEVAKIAQDTLHGYFLGVGHTQRLVCQLRPGHNRMFFSTDNAIRKRKHLIETERINHENKLVDPDALKKMTSTLMKQDKKKRAKLAALGIDYDFPGYQASSSSSPSDDKNVKNGETKTDGDKPTSPDPSTNGDKPGSKKDKKKKESSGSNDKKASSSERKRKNSLDSQNSTDPTDEIIGSSAQKKKKSSKKEKNRRKSAP